MRKASVVRVWLVYTDLGRCIFLYTYTKYVGTYFMFGWLKDSMFVHTLFPARRDARYGHFAIYAFVLNIVPWPTRRSHEPRGRSKKYRRKDGSWRLQKNVIILHIAFVPVLCNICRNWLLSRKRKCPLRSNMRTAGVWQTRYKERANKQIWRWKKVDSAAIRRQDQDVGTNVTLSPYSFAWLIN